MNPAMPGIDISRALKIQGWMRRQELIWLAQMARRSPTILEIGSWKGRSTRALADHCPGVVYTVDLWKDPEEDVDQTNPELQERGPEAIRTEWQENLRDLLDAGGVVLINEHSPALAAVTRYVEAVDLLFIDGDHSDGGCRADIEAYGPLVRKGGVLSGHDYGEKKHPGVRRAVDAIFGKCRRGPGSIWWVHG